MVRIVGEGSHGWSKGRQINIENKDDNFDVWLKADVGWKQRKLRFVNNYHQRLKILSLRGKKF
jgi:hypothetical protein